MVSIKKLSFLLCLFLMAFYIAVSCQIILDPSTKNKEHKVALYLTFDDGPCAGSIEVNLITISDSIKVNVFIIGSHVFLNDTMKSYYQSYLNNPFIEIGNHSFSHANGKYRKYYENPSLVMKDFLMNEDTLHLKNKIARLPGRNIWRLKKRSRDDFAGGNAAADSLAERKYSVFGWDIEWLYNMELSEEDTSNEMVAMIENMLKQKTSLRQWNIVILCHDQMLENKYDKDALQLFIRKIKDKKNYSFEHLSDYPKSLSN